MYYSGYAYGLDKNYKTKKQQALEKLKDLEYERISNSPTYNRCHYIIKFKDITAPVTEHDVIFGIANMCFGGSCDKLEPGVFKVMEHTD
jgi:hypothetical protein